MLVHLAVQPRGAVFLSDVMVIGNPGEQVMRPGRDVRSVSPLLALQGHVSLFLVLLQVPEQRRHSVARRMLKGERDEDETDAQEAELVPRDRILLVEPLEGGRVVERESSLGESSADLGAEGLRVAAF